MSGTEQTILVTGAAGFIGHHVVTRLASEGYRVTGLDNLNAYYDVELKLGRLAEQGVRIDGGFPEWNPVDSATIPGYRFCKGDITGEGPFSSFWDEVSPDIVIHLAAQAGVRYSIERPGEYIESNVRGFFNVLENCRRSAPRHLLYASSSSVYGWNEEIPFRTDHACDRPASLYAATKKSNELMAASYSSLYGIPATGMRFFTVYGPWGRPDMAYFLFAKSILANEPIDVFNEGRMSRDFTYVDDVVETIRRLMELAPGAGLRHHRVLNIGRGEPAELMDFIEAIESSLGGKAVVRMKPMQPGDVPATWADTGETVGLTGYSPGVGIGEGIRRFASWFLERYGRNAQ